MLCVCIIPRLSSSSSSSSSSSLSSLLLCVCFLSSFPYVEHACLYFSVFIPHPDITVMADWALKIVIYLFLSFIFNFLHAFVVPEGLQSTLLHVILFITECSWLTSSRCNE